MQSISDIIDHPGFIIIVVMGCGGVYNLLEIIIAFLYSHKTKSPLFSTHTHINVRRCLVSPEWDCQVPLDFIFPLYVCVCVRVGLFAIRF